MSEFWKRKLKTFFRRFDCNGDGFLTKEDFELLAERFGEGLNEDSVQRKRMRETCLAFFGQFEIAKVTTDDGKLTEDKFLEGLIHARNEQQLAVIVAEGSVLAFDMLDTNGDGMIQLEEYVRLLYNLGIRDHENLAEIAFKSIDTNQDGELSREEFRDAFFDYVLSDEEKSQETFLFGPLI